MTPSTVTTIPEVHVDGEARDGRVSIEAADPEATVRLKRVRAAPLAEGQTAGHLEIVADGLQVDVDLAGADVDALADALYHLQEQLREEVA